jgi:hypothetical protein
MRSANLDTDAVLAEIVRPLVAAARYPSPARRRTPSATTLGCCAGSCRCRSPFDVSGTDGRARARGHTGAQAGFISRGSFSMTMLDRSDRLSRLLASRISMPTMGRSWSRSIVTPSSISRVLRQAGVPAARVATQTQVSEGSVWRIATEAPAAARAGTAEETKRSVGRPPVLQGGIKVYISSRSMA